MSSILQRVSLKVLDCGQGFSWLLIIPSYHKWLQAVCFPSLATHHVAMSVNPCICFMSHPTNRSHPLSPQNRAGERKAGVKAGRGHRSVITWNRWWLTSSVPIVIAPTSQSFPTDSDTSSWVVGVGDRSPSHVFPPQTTRTPESLIIVGTQKLSPPVHPYRDAFHHHRGNFSIFDHNKMDIVGSICTLDYFSNVQDQSRPICRSKTIPKNGLSQDTGEVTPRINFSF